MPRLPLAVHQLMLVARLPDLQQVEEVDVSVTMRNPKGSFATPTDDQGVVIEMTGEYVLVTLRSVPLVEEGVYQFQIALGGQPPSVVEVPVFATNTRDRRPHRITGPAVG